MCEYKNVRSRYDPHKAMESCLYGIDHNPKGCPRIEGEAAFGTVEVARLPFKDEVKL